MVLKPQDILVIMKLVALGRAKWSYNSLAYELGMSPSEVHAAVKRSLAAHLVFIHQDKAMPNPSGLKEFLIHGLKYVFVPDRGEMTRGMPTGHAAPPLIGFFADTGEPPPVWPDPEGNVRGQAFSPLYKCVPHAARKDEALYELLVLIDAIRGGRAREQAMAIQELEKWLRCDDARPESQS